MPSETFDSWSFIKRARNTISDLQREHQLSYRQAVACAICVELLRKESDHWRNPASREHRHECLRQTVNLFAQHLPGELGAAGFLRWTTALQRGDEAGVYLMLWMKTKEGAETLHKVFYGADDVDRLRRAVRKAMDRIARDYPRRRFRKVNDEFLSDVLSILRLSDDPLGVLRLHDGDMDYSDWVIRSILEKHLEEISETPGVIGEGAAALLEQAVEAVDDVQTAIDALTGMEAWAETKGPATVALMERARSRLSGGGRGMTDRVLLKRFGLQSHALSSLKEQFAAEYRRRLEDRATA